MLAEFETAAELRAHYAAVKARLNPARKPLPPPSEETIAQSVPQSDAVPPGYVTPKEAAEKLGVPHAYVLYWCRRSPHAVKLKGRWFLDERAFDVLLDSAGPPKTNTEGMWDCVRVAAAHARLSPSAQRAKQVVADLRWYFGQETVAAFMADRREPHRVFVRWVAFYLVSKVTIWSLVGVARYFQRDHTTVLHGLNELRKLRVENASIDHLLTWLEAKYGLG
jgi:hypothetical protein